MLTQADSGGCSRRSCRSHLDMAPAPAPPAAAAAAAVHTQQQQLTFLYTISPANALELMRRFCSAKSSGVAITSISAAKMNCSNTHTEQMGSQLFGCFTISCVNISLLGCGHHIHFCRREH
jgi:hypothetical protein